MSEPRSDEPSPAHGAPLAAELDQLLARAGLDISEERRPVMCTCLAEVRRWGEMIAAARLDIGDEPANCFAVGTVDGAHGTVTRPHGQ
jgi:hypothetical protein